MFWYFSPKYLTQACLSYYQPILSKIIQKKATPCLVDLSAWANFNALSFSPELGLNRAYTAAGTLNSDHLYILKSSDFFQALLKIQEGPVFRLLKTISQCEDLLTASIKYPYNGLSVAQTLGECAVLSDFYEEDCTKIYSLLQYFELLFYVEMLLLKNPALRSIKFILPNDEHKYYPNINTLQTDLSAFLSYRLDFQGTLDVQLLCFKYSKRSSNRPYLNTTQGIVDPTRRLYLNDITDPPELNMPFAVQGGI